MTVTRTLLCLALGAALLNVASLHAEERPAPIRAIEQKGVRVVGPFDAPGGLRGYAAEYRNQGVALYLTPDGKHVLSGQLFDADGNDLTSEPLERLVFAPKAKTVWANLEKSAWIADGRNDAPRIVYVFDDPNCPYCNMFWKQARPWVDAGKVQLRHVMVGILREDSAPKAAALLAAKDPAKALREHEADPKGGVLQPLATIPVATQAKLDANLALMQALGAMATPAIFYRDASGRLGEVQGAPRPENLSEILGPN